MNEILAAIAIALIWYALLLACAVLFLFVMLGRMIARHRSAQRGRRKGRRSLFSEGKSRP